MDRLVVITSGGIYPASGTSESQRETVSKVDVRTGNGRERRSLLAMGVAIDVGIHGYNKYTCSASAHPKLVRKSDYA